MGLVVAGMAEGEGRISCSQHGSQVNVYLLLSTQFFLTSSKSFSFFYPRIANYDDVITV